MKRWIAIGGIVILVGSLLVIVGQRDCGPRPTAMREDSLFIPARRDEIRPKSLPFEPEPEIPVDLPSAVIRSSRKILVIVKRLPVDSIRTIEDTTVIVLQDADLLRVMESPGRETEVNEYRVLRPWVALQRTIGVGVTLADGLRPSLAFSPVSIAGVIDLPLIAIDPSGISLGAGYRHNEHVLFGVGYHLGFEENSRTITLSAHYTL